MSLDSLLVSIENSVATVTLNRPERLNALTVKMFRELGEVFAQLDDDGTVRAIVLNGAGRSFCAGGDIQDILINTAKAAPVPRERIVHLCDETMLRIWRTGKPTIAAIHGATVGGGATLSLACDMRIAAADTRIGFVFTARGLAGADLGGTWFLPRIVGMGRAAELLLGAEIIDAAQAERIGLVNRVVPPEELQATAQRVAAKLAAGPPIAMRMTKRSLIVGTTNDLASHLEYEDLAQTFCIGTQGAEEGVRSFLERREPSFPSE